MANMNTSRSMAVFILLLAALAAFVVVTSQGMPLVVASHFGVNGLPNGFMPRTTYTVVMLVLVVVLPFLLAALPSALARRGGAGLNIPNRAYWLAPERYAATAAYLNLQGKVSSGALALFLAYVHWLVVRANASIPAALPLAPFYAGMVAFLVIVALQVGSLYAHYGRRA